MIFAAPLRVQPMPRCFILWPTTVPTFLSIAPVPFMSGGRPGLFLFSSRYVKSSSQ
jgi:hypothetical protein